MIRRWSDGTGWRCGDRFCSLAHRWRWSAWLCRVLGGSTGGLPPVPPGGAIA